mmetsp:Transcript_15903/g.20069  ORF Transcript_15903/g.20069 Transcript_15903/m.20069 type:complete len:260 (+) Transcript_15903:386-1165(+)
MLRPIEVNQVRKEFLSVRVVGIGDLRVDSLDLGLAFLRVTGRFTFLSCRSCSCFLLLKSALLFFFLFLFAFGLFVNFLLFGFILGLLLDHLSELLNAAQIAAEPVFDADFDLCALKATQDFLVTQNIAIGKRVLDISQQGVVLGQFDEPIGEHGLIEKVFGPLDIVLAYLIRVNGSTVCVDAQLEQFALIGVQSSGVDGLFEHFEAVVDRVECVVVAATHVCFEARLAKLVRRDRFFHCGGNLVVNCVRVDFQILHFDI